jgi:hypothetical protein
MATNKKIEEMDDREFEALIKLLRPVEARDPNTVMSGRVNYEAELDYMLMTRAQYGFGWLAGVVSRFRLAKEKPMMNSSTPRFVFSALAMIIVIFVLLFGSAGATVYAAQSALPGDTLYTLKTGLEQTQVNLSRDAANRAQLHLDFADRRLSETAALIEEGRFNDIGAATAELEYHIQQAIGELQTVALGDPLRAETLAGDITSALTRYASTLSGMLANVPESVRPDVERAIQSSQFAGGNSSMDDSQEEIEISGTVEEIGPDGWLINGQFVAIDAGSEIEDDIQVGDIVKIHATQNEDGSLTAREIELAEDLSNDNGNENDNDNGNDDDGNENDNDNDDMNDNDDDGNQNDNDNGNDDDGNGNYNDNDDDMNDNDDDGNQNDDDGNQNDNDNDHDDDSDNDHDDDSDNDHDDDSNNDHNDDHDDDHNDDHDNDHGDDD